VGEVSDVAVGSGRGKGEGVAPEVELKDDDCIGGGDGPDEG
jgi:hypothetical protein